MRINMCEMTIENIKLIQNKKWDLKFGLQMEQEDYLKKLIEFNFVIFTNILIFFKRENFL